MFAWLMNPGTASWCTTATATISRSCSTTGIHRRNRTIFRHLFLSRASRMTLRIASLRGVETRGGHVVPCEDGLFGIATPSGERPALDRPGPRTMASTMRTLVQLVAGDLLDDLPAGHHQHPVAETGELERVARLDQQRGSGVGPRAQRRVDVEAGADVDALGRLVREDHRRLPEERSRDGDLLLVATGQELDRLLERRRADLESARRVPAPSRAPPAGAASPITAEPAQRSARWR